FTVNRVRSIIINQPRGAAINAEARTGRRADRKGIRPIRQRPPGLKPDCENFSEDVATIDFKQTEWAAKTLIKFNVTNNAAFVIRISGAAKHMSYPFLVAELDSCIWRIILIEENRHHI